jgi:hypothetical protein
MYRFFLTIKRIFFPLENLPKILMVAVLPYVCSSTKQTRLSCTVGCTLTVLNTAGAAERRFGPPPKEEVMRGCKNESKGLQKFEKRAVFLRVLLNDQKWWAVEKWITAHRNDGIYVFTKMITFEEESLSGSPDNFSVLQLSGETCPNHAHSNWDDTKRRYCSFGNVSNAMKKSCFDIEQVRQGCTDTGRRIARAAKFCTPAPDIWGSSV